MKTVRFQSGALGLIEGTTCAYPGFSTRLDIHGEKGSILLENDMVKFWALADGPDYDDKAAKQGVSTHTLQLREITDAILSGRDPIVTGEEAIKFLKIVLAIYRSILEKRPVHP